MIAAVTGHAIAGGLVLALGADMRVASLEGRYGLTEVKVGVPYPQAAIGLVRAELAPQAARSLVLSNRLIDGAETLQNLMIRDGMERAADQALRAGQIISRLRGPSLSPQPL